MATVHTPRAWATRPLAKPASVKRDRLDWVENAAIECLKGHHASADLIAKEAVTTLTVLLLGIGGGFTYTVHGIQTAHRDWITDGAVGFTIYLIVVALLLIYKCMRIGEIPSVWNEPRALYQPKYSLAAVREVELENIQARIDMAAARNARTATWLNRFRVAAALSPLAFIFSLAVGAAVPAWDSFLCLGSGLYERAGVAVPQVCRPSSHPLVK